MESINWIDVAVGTVISALIGMLIGLKKGEGINGFFIGLFLGPLGWIVVAVMRGNRVNCPFCKELIHEEASVCPRCQKEQPSGR